MARKPTAWNQHVQQVYKEMKAHDGGTKFKDALKAAAKTYKKQAGGTIGDMRGRLAASALQPAFLETPQNEALGASGGGKSKRRRTAKKVKKSKGGKRKTAKKTRKTRKSKKSKKH